MKHEQAREKWEATLAAILDSLVLELTVLGRFELDVYGLRWWRNRVLPA
jgi:hypothetical protein